MSNCKKGYGSASLEAEIREEVTKLFETALDYSQIACPDPNTYKVLRGKILGAGNDCIRTLVSKLKEYDIHEKNIKEDLIITNKC